MSQFRQKTTSEPGTEIGLLLGLSPAVHRSLKLRSVSFGAILSATLLLEIGVAIALVGAYRRFAQRRPLSGPGAYRFPARGFGIARMRTRLRQLGIDPDRHVRPGSTLKPQDLAADKVAEQLENLRT